MNSLFRLKLKKVGKTTRPFKYDINQFLMIIQWRGIFPGGSEDKVSACNAGDLGSIPGLGRSPEEGNGNPLQYYPANSQD